MKPLQTGVALLVTIAIFYLLCMLIEVMWPEQFMGSVNALFHRRDFRMLWPAGPYRWSSYSYALVVVAVWTFVSRPFFAWLHNAMGKSSCHGVVRHG
jgi:hypothetical protein